MYVLSSVQTDERNLSPVHACSRSTTLLATALFSTLGMVCGTAIGRKFGQKSKFAAGIVLVIIGIRIILQ